MKLAGVLVAVAACVAPEETSEVESTLAPTSAQGAVGQGSSMQGSSMQGSSMQGSSMQGSSMQGSYGGSGVSYATVDGTALSFWRRASKTTWEQRFPNRTCYWNSTRTILQSCTWILRGQPSPLVGSTWPTTFVKKNEDGSTTSIAVTLRIEAVRNDSTVAMFPLTGSDYASAAAVPCEHPEGCRRNTDIWNYDVRATDVLDDSGNPVWLCPAGQTAIALAGTWPADQSYAHQPSTTAFTFACTNGTIAKCTRWGYRPYDRAIMTGDSAAEKISLAGYHQACIRAAAADYCGNGKSFTMDGTLVDIYDYTYANDKGFVPQLRYTTYSSEAASAFAHEASFDSDGADRIDHTRYAELESTPTYGTIEEACPGRFYLGADSSDDVAATYNRIAPPLAGPVVNVMSTTACSHSEYIPGKYLHTECSSCAASAPPECREPAHGWTQACVDWVNANDNWGQVCYQATQRITAHSECAVGGGLLRYDTGCTLAVCLSNPGCCSTAGWTSACVGAANTTCKGGLEGGFLGFCGLPYGQSPTNPPTTKNGG